MTKKLIQIIQRTRTLQLTWIINNICTNHCDYCPPSLHTGTNYHYDWNIAKNFIERLLKRYSKIHCSVSGGEPTLSPFFPELVKLFYDAGHTVGITSNAGRSTRYLEEIAPYLSYICFSYHPSYEDPKFLEKVIAVSKHTDVSVRIMMDSRHWDNAVEMYNKCAALTFIGVETVKVLSEMAGGKHIGDDYSEEQLKWLTNSIKTRPLYKEYANNKKWRLAHAGATFFYDNGEVEEPADTNYLISSEQNDFRGWACNIGLESMFIHYNGIVKKANCLQGGELFHIDDHENYEFPRTAELCVQKMCNCGTDIMISKVPLVGSDHPVVEQGITNFDKKRKIIKIVPETL